MKSRRQNFYLYGMLLVFIAALLSISQIIYLKSSIFEIIEHTVSPKSTTDLLKEISHHARRGFIFDRLAPAVFNRFLNLV